MKHNDSKSIKSIFQKILSVFVSISMVSSIIAGCVSTLITGIKPAAAHVAQTASVQNTLQMAVSASQNISRDQQVFIDYGEDTAAAHRWDEYIGDFDMFVYGLLVSEYSSIYEVFNGMITLPDGTDIYGIGYTDFDSYFESDDGLGFFPAGFIPLIGESDIPEEDIESGLEIIDIDQMDIGLSFVLAYDIEPFLQHCVIWNKYLQYGIDEDGRITYNTEDYVRGHCNESLGALYSYDERRFVFDPNVGNYRYIVGQSLYTPIDYAALEAEVNRILEEQDFNFSMVEVRTAVYTAQEAYNNYLLSLQEESFMGYPVKDLIALSEQLDPMQLIRLTPEGHVIVNIADEIPNTADALTKWLTGIRIGITLACTGVSIMIPAFAPAAGAISMASCNVFSQILDENRSLSNINWGKVAISAVTGAMLAWAIPTMSGNITHDLILNGASEAVSKLAGYSLQGISSGVIHGVSDSISNMMDGQNLNETWDIFLISAAQSAAISLAFSGAFEVLNPVMEKIAPVLDDVIDNFTVQLKKVLGEKPNGWFSRAVNKIGEWDVHQIHLDNEELDRFLTPRSVYESAKVASQELNIQSAFKAEAYRLLPKNDNNFNYFSKDGQLLSKDLIDIDDMNFIIKPSDTCDPDILNYFEQRGISELQVVNGVINFSDVSHYTFIAEEGISSNRAVNFLNYSNQLAKEWGKDPSKIPPEIRKLLTETELENLTGTIVRRILQEAGITFHEGADNAVYLVNRVIHENIKHAGGVFLAKLRETITTGIDYLKWVIYGIEPVVIESVVS